jgi:tetratricopeptide (TPR) repeat protein
MGDRLWIGECLSYLGEIFRAKGEYERARIYFEQSLALYREIGDQEGTAFTLHLLGAMILFWLPVADTVLEAQACAFLEESRELFYQSGSSIISNRSIIGDLLLEKRRL